MTATGDSYKPRHVDDLLDALLAELPALVIVGARATGKTTTAARRAATTIRLDREAEAAAFVADPDVALRGLPEPVLLDEWQQVPGVFGAVRRAVEEDPRPNRFLLTGSVRAELENEVWPGTGRLVKVAMHPMTVRELHGRGTGPLFLDRVLEGQGLVVPPSSPDLRGYLGIALASGFPMPALRLSGRPRGVWLGSYLEQLLTHDVERFEQPATKRRDPLRLRRYFEAYALMSAGITEHASIYRAAGVSKVTGASYESLLTDLFVVEQIPAWASNRLKRLVKQPKRYVVDAGLIGAALRLDENAVVRDGNLLGRVLDTLVMAQLRAEVEAAAARPRLHHLRTDRGRQEIDLVAEYQGERVVAFEIKATASPSRRDARHLEWLRDMLDDRFVAGVVFHTGPRCFSLGERIVAAPISVLWDGDGAVG